MDEERKMLMPLKLYSWYHSPSPNDFLILSPSCLFNASVHTLGKSRSTKMLMTDNEKSHCSQGYSHFKGHHLKINKKYSTFNGKTSDIVTQEENALSAFPKYYQVGDYCLEKSQRPSWSSIAYLNSSAMIPKPVYLIAIWLGIASRINLESKVFCLPEYNKILRIIF